MFETLWPFIVDGRSRRCSITKINNVANRLISFAHLERSSKDCCAINNSFFVQLPFCFCIFYLYSLKSSLSTWTHPFMFSSGKGNRKVISQREKTFIIQINIHIGSARLSIFPHFGIHFMFYIMFIVCECERVCTERKKKENENCSPARSPQWTKKPCGFSATKSYRVKSPSLSSSRLSAWTRWSDKKEAKRHCHHHITIHAREYRCVYTTYAHTTWHETLYCASIEIILYAWLSIVLFFSALALSLFALSDSTLNQRFITWFGCYGNKKPYQEMLTNKNNEKIKHKFMRNDCWRSLLLPWHWP